MSNIFKLDCNFKPTGDQPNAIKKLISGITDGYFEQTLLGVTGSGKTFSVANVIKSLQRPTLILAPNKTLAAQLYSEMKSFFPESAVEYFVSYYDYYQPEAYVATSDTYIEKDSSINEQIERMRLSATKSLFERKDCIIVASVSAIYGLGDAKQYLEMVLSLKVGQEIEQRKILRRLAELQYSRNDTDFKRAVYRVRGDVIDIFPADANVEAIRLELFADEIEKISLFDPLTGKVIKKIKNINIYPKSHYVTPRQRLLDTIEEIKIELKKRVKYFEKNNKFIEAQRIEQRTLFDIEMMLELGYCSGIENYSRYLSGRSEGEPPPTLIEYMPENSLLIIDESHVTIPQIGAMYKGDRSRKENLVNYGFRLPSALDNRPLKFEEFVNLQPATIYVSATPSDYEKTRSCQIVEQLIRPTGLLDPLIEIRPVASQVDDLLSEINKVIVNNERVLVTTLTKKMAEDLTSYLVDHGIKVRYLHSDVDTIERVEILKDLRLGEFDVLVGINLLREGLDLPEVSRVAILDADREGFLRSERSLIQTIGRVARNSKGKAILYADKITKAMNYAITETKRRRKIQKEYNKLNNIIPKTVFKNIDSIMSAENNNKTKKSKVKEYNKLNSEELMQKIKKLEDKMFKFAKDLEFEKAANLRDEINNLQDILLSRSQ